MSPDLIYKVIPLTEVPLDKALRTLEKEHPIVLVVDDERVIADALSTILTRKGFFVLTAYDGSSALELARRIAPDLLLSDVMLGAGMNGIQLAVEMIKSFPECRVLLFSGHAATKGLLEKARDDGHDFALMTKPVHPADLLKCVMESLSSPDTSQAHAVHQ